MTTRSHRIPPPPTRFGLPATPQAKPAPGGARSAGTAPPPTRFPGAGAQMKSAAGRNAFPPPAPLSFGAAAALQMSSKGATLAIKNQRRIRANKISSGQHGGMWEPSGSAGGAKVAVAAVETRADAVVRLTADVAGCTAKNNPAKLVKAVKKRIDDAIADHGDADNAFATMRALLP
jgi:hypothetical protein